jgi:hypothetical protein
VAWNTNPTLTIILFFKDDDNAESEHRVNVPLSALSGAVAFAKSYASLYRAVSNCALWKIRITSVFKDDGSQVAAPASNAKRQSVLVFETEAGQIYNVAIPGLISAKLLTVGPYAGVQLDTSDPAIGALVDLLINGDGQVRPVAPWNADNGGANEWEWAGVPLQRLITAYWGYERPGWQ